MLLAILTSFWEFEGNSESGNRDELQKLNSAIF